MPTRKLKAENSTKKNLVGRTVQRQTSRSENSKGEKGTATSKTVFKKDGSFARYKGQFTPDNTDAKGKRTVAVTKMKATDNPKKKTIPLMNVKAKSSSYTEKVRGSKSKDAPKSILSYGQAPNTPEMIRKTYGKMAQQGEDITSPNSPGGRALQKDIKSLKPAGETAKSLSRFTFPAKKGRMKP